VTVDKACAVATANRRARSCKRSVEDGHMMGVLALLETRIQNKEDRRTPKTKRVTVEMKKQARLQNGWLIRSREITIRHQNNKVRM
jgi:hypothetical protein